MGLAKKIKVALHLQDPDNRTAAERLDDFIRAAKPLGDDAETGELIRVMREREERMQAELDKLKKENNRLANENRKLKDDGKAEERQKIGDFGFDLGFDWYEKNPPPKFEYDPNDFDESAWQYLPSLRAYQHRASKMVIDRRQYQDLMIRSRFSKYKNPPF